MTEVKAGRPCRTTKKSKGIALIQFADAEGALAAKEALDGAIFQGRLLHVLPARRPPPPKQAPEQASAAALPAQPAPGCVPKLKLRQVESKGQFCAHPPEYEHGDGFRALGISGLLGRQRAAAGRQAWRQGRTACGGNCAA